MLLAPFVRDNDKILNTSNYAMLHVVQIRFPELSSSARIMTGGCKPCSMALLHPAPALDLEQAD